MILAKTLKKIEYDRILDCLKDKAVLEQTKAEIMSFNPVSDLSEAEFLLKKTEESYTLLYRHSVGGIYFFPCVLDQLSRADRGGTLTIKEILDVTAVLKSARIMKTAIDSVNDESIKIIPEITSRLFVNLDFEKEISSKIISEDELSDNASPKLFELRKKIRNLNASIRDRLNSYLRGNSNKFLQESVVTLRRDRYVIPVKSEYRSLVKGFIHDQSSSGATVFIEPEQVMEMNNELKHAMFEETNEIHRILAELTTKITYMSDGIRFNMENLTEIDNAFARAIYSFENKNTKPILNNKGIMKAIKARHPLIDKEKVVPVSVELGDKYNFLLITGPNTGGKTVTLKLTGLLSLMAMSGLYVPCSDESKISIFDSVFCDIGDEQSIEQSLSTFSSHIKNIKEILNSATEKSLVLIDEIGAGTDPEEGSALALAIIKNLLESNAKGIITTHYSALKEFAVNSGKIENASMEFDPKSLKPMYKLNIGIPGSSNAIDIAKTLGIDDCIIKEAVNNLSDSKIGFENIIKKAEEARREAERLSLELDVLKKEKESELNLIQEERAKITAQKEKIYNTAKQETKRIVSDKLVEAEEIVLELKEILKRVGLESKEVFKASELKNRLSNSKYLSADFDDKPLELKKTENKNLKIGSSIYVKSLNAYAKLLSVNNRKGEAEVAIGSIKSVVKTSDLYNQKIEKEENKNIKIFKSSNLSKPETELNVIGKTSLEALDEVKRFIDQAVRHNLEEIKVIHGVGEGILLKEIRSYLKGDKYVKEFRRGRYGEGENGVTIITLK